MDRLPKPLLVALVVANAVVLLGQLWPDGAPPFARWANVAFLVANLLVLLGALVVARGSSSTQRGSVDPAPPEEKQVQPQSGPAPGWVSVWVGDFTDELDLDGYFGPEFKRDHGVSPTGEGEYRIEPTPVPLATILGDCYLGSRWVPKVLTVAEQRGIPETSCVVVDFHYRHVEADPPASPLTFLACVQLD